MAGEGARGSIDWVGFGVLCGGSLVIHLLCYHSSVAGRQLAIRERLCSNRAIAHSSLELISGAAPGCFPVGRLPCY